MTDQWYIYQGQQQKGPYTMKQLKDLADTGVISPGDQVWAEGMKDWITANRVEGLFQSSPIAPPPPPVSQANQHEAVTPFKAASSDTTAPTGKKKMSGFKIAAIIGGSLITLLVVLIVIITFSVRSALRSSEVYSQAMVSLQANSQAILVLGEPILAGNSVSGSINVSNDTGDAEITIPVSGSLSKGALNVTGIRSAGQWRLTKLDLQTESGETLNLLGGTYGNVPGMLTFNEPGYGFTMNYPQHWSYETTGDVVDFRGPQGTEEYDNEIRVQVLLSSQAGGLYPDFDAMYADLDELYSSLGGDIFEYDSGTDFIGDDTYPYMIVGAYFIYEGEEYMELSMSIERDSNHYYVLYYTVPSSMGDKYMDLVFDEIFESFRFVAF